MTILLLNGILFVNGILFCHYVPQHGATITPSITVINSMADTRITDTKTPGNFQLGFKPTDPRAATPLSALAQFTAAVNDALAEHKTVTMEIRE
jgi:hypothetical protein